jgi:probable F420-dependent oxidoreductase
VWVSDHIAVPKGAPYPPPFLFEPLISLTWAAAATSRIGIGTSIYILPLRPVLATSKQMATLDLFSGGRLTLGAGAGWLEAEFDAVNVRHADRQAITDEYIDDLRTSWTTRPFTLTGKFTRGENLVVLPQPNREIPIWIGGMGTKAVQRALSKGDGWHGYGPVADVCNVATQLRTGRPDDAFTLSVRVDWDGLATSAATIEEELDTFSAAGIQHVVACPAQSNIDDWLRSVETLARTFALI